MDKHTIYQLWEMYGTKEYAQEVLTFVAILLAVYGLAQLIGNVPFWVWTVVVAIVCASNPKSKESVISITSKLLEIVENIQRQST